jgi:hypothetical protein
MKAKSGREAALLMLPILIIGGVAWWKNRNGPPEDLMSGQARIVTRVRTLEVTPLDLYRGYTHKIAIDQWAAGELPPTPVPRPGATRSYRQIQPRYSPLYVTFRQGSTWKRTISVESQVEEEVRKIVKVPAVPLSVARLNMETVDSVGNNREMFTSRYSVRLPVSPRVEEAFLCGRVRADIQDRDVRMVAGVRTGDILPSSGDLLHSTPLRVPLLLEAESEMALKRKALQTVEWKIEHVVVTLPGALEGNYLRLNMSMRSQSGSAAPGRVRLVTPRLLDARGRVAGKLNNYSSGSSEQNGQANTTVVFDMTMKEWRALAKPLTFQAAVSVDDGWPEEVNIELEAPDKQLPPKKSRLDFVRDPLPLP